MLQNTSQALPKCTARDGQGPVVPRQRTHPSSTAITLPAGGLVALPWTTKARSTVFPLLPSSPATAVSHCSISHAGFASVCGNSGSWAAGSGVSSSAPSARSMVRCPSIAAHASCSGRGSSAGGGSRGTGSILGRAGCLRRSGDKGSGRRGVQCAGLFDFLGGKGSGGDGDDKHGDSRARQEAEVQGRGCVCGRVQSI